LWLSDKDKDALIDEGLLNEEALPGRVELDISNALRISTMFVSSQRLVNSQPLTNFCSDNFQGEEAKVVILTTVRSNPECRSGFLKRSNRINVACSRARDGLYIIGNSQSLESVPMWKRIM
jgi:hypothetical protein